MSERAEGLNQIFENDVTIMGTCRVNKFKMTPGAGANKVLTSDASGNGTWATSSGEVTGMIKMWNGTIATIPTGYVLCNGSNGTPDLRNKFIVGAQEDSAGVAKTNVTGSLTQSGGANSHTHTDSGHTHSFTVGCSTYGSCSGYTCGPSCTTQVQSGTGTYVADQYHYHSFYVSISISVSCSSTTATGNANISTCATLPPYYALAFVMKT